LARFQSRRQRPAAPSPQVEADPVSGYLDSNGVSNGQATAANMVAAQGAGTHVGTPTQFFVLAINGSTVTFQPGTPFIADGAMYAAIGAGSPLVTWSN
jgi:hypothetical protein